MGITKDELELADRVRRVRERAVDVLGSSARAITWLQAPNEATDGAPPVQIAAVSADGVARVLRALSALEGGNSA